MEQRYAITVEQENAQFFCREDQFVLPAMISARCGSIYHGCCGGGCGVCRMQVVQGEYAVIKPMSRAHVSEQDQKQGIVLLCCIQPRSNLVLRRVKDKNK